MIVLINPNSTVAMTEAAAATARAVLPGRVVAGWTSTEGPEAIQGEADGAAAVPPLLRLLPQAEAAGAKAILIACADDTGLAEARAEAQVPVLGIGQAAYASAHLLGHPWSVVTTLAVSVPILEANVHTGGYGGQCLRVAASGIAVLELERAPDAYARLLAAVRAEQASGARAVVLGCAGMTGFRSRLAEDTGMWVIDGVTAAALQADALLRTLTL